MTISKPSIHETVSGRQRLVRHVLIYLAIWLAVLIALVAQTRWGINLTWPQAMVRVIRDWIPWVILGPILWWLVKRFPIFGEKKWRNLVIHFLVSGLMAVVAETLVAFVIHPATQPVMEKASLSDRDLIREIRGNRRRPHLRQDEYRLRPKSLVRKAQIWFPLNWVFVLLGTSVLLRKRDEERSRRALILQHDLAEARLRELQGRLQPHFLFNALNSVSALIVVDPEKAEEMVNRLSALLRRVLTSSEKPLIPLSEELKLLRDYLAIEEVRFPDRLFIEESISDAALSCLIPPLTLQPLAENAVKHGIEPKSSSSLLQIIARTQNSNLVLQIIDDGVGLNSTGRASGLGIGIGNVKSRLETAFPGKASLSLDHPSGGGTSITIHVPIVTEIEF